MRSLRVVTLNLWGDHAPLAARLDVAAAGLAALSPDVVLLQEVRAGEGLPNTAEQLVERLPSGAAAATSGGGGAWHCAYACATRAAAGAWGAGSAAGEEGLAIVSRWPLGEVSDLELPEARPASRRILLSARLECGAPDVWLHTTHLHWRLDDGVAREKQVAAIDDALRARGNGALHVLGGDFNAAPVCDEVRFLCGQHTLGGRRAHYQDTWARVHPLEPGWTWARRNPYCLELGWLDPDRRIDYVFASTERRDGRGRILDARVVLDAPDAEGTWPSDHFAVCAEILVAP
jgi:endonuclease/exonuclease/phosphatase family metal-dependent hydrolase